MKKIAAVLSLALLVCACAVAAIATATASAAAPLNQYVVTHVNPKALGEGGFDRREAAVPGKPGEYIVVATPSQANALRGKGATVKPLDGVSKSRSAPKRARGKALANPTHGYNVFRPWSLQPAPCPGTCATPNIPLKSWYHSMAIHYPRLVKEEVIGTTRQGQQILAYKVTKDARKLRDGRRPAALYDSTQHAREWIATETERRLFQWFLTNSSQRDVARLLKTRELWFVPVVNPDGYDYTFQNAETRLWRKNLRDNNGDGVIADGDGVDTNRNSPYKWNWDLEGASDDPFDETFHGPSAGSEPEVRAMRGLESRIRPRFQIDYHSFAKL